MKQLSPSTRLLIASIFELVVLFAVIFIDIAVHLPPPVVYITMIIATAIAAFIFVDFNK